MSAPARTLLARGSDDMLAIDTGPRRRDAAFSILVEPRPAGATIGLYRGLPIAERVTDQFGRLFAYAGIIGRQRDGQYDVGGLKPGEFIVEPGLVYNLEKGKERPKAAPTPDARGEDRRVVVQITAILAFFLSSALAIQFVLRLFHIG